MLKTDWTFLKPTLPAIARSAAIGASANAESRGVRSSTPKTVSMVSSWAIWTGCRSIAPYEDIHDKALAIKRVRGRRRTPKRNGRRARYG